MVAELPSFYFWLIWIIPFIGCLVTTLMGRMGRARDYTAVLFSFVSALFSFLVLVPVLENQTFSVQNSVFPISVPWIPDLAGRYSLNMGVLTDPYTIILTNIVSWIGFLIMVYSLDYMRGGWGLTRYWFFMNFFLGSMQLIVLSDNLLSLFIGWEGVGLASYALIGFYYRDRLQYWVGTPGDKALGEEQAYSPSHAGMKAFVMTRVGDMAFLAGLFILFYYAGTFSFKSLSANTGWITALGGAGLIVPVALLLFGGAIGKSAQFPLHEWLPDAMAGPAPVSALIHAATMVNAGVILLARIGPLFYFALAGNPSLIQPFFLTVAWIGGFTAILAATQGMVGYELKKILAYSTSSQIGYMVMALGLTGLGLSSNFSEGLSAGLFHLMSQAIFKACLFMAAGVLIHVTDSKYINDMGGLKDRMKLTAIVFLIAVAALSGIPPLSGFWSKDAVLATAWDAGQFGLFAVGAVTAGITAFYSFRMFGIIFFGGASRHLQALEGSGGHTLGATHVSEGVAEAHADIGFTHLDTPTSNPGVSDAEGGHGSAWESVRRHEKEQGGREEDEQEGSQSHHGVHERSPLAWIPYTILGIMCVVIGIGAPIFNLERVLESAATTYLDGLFPNVAPSTIPDTPFNYAASGITLAFVIVGVAAAWYLYIGRRAEPQRYVRSTGFAHQLYNFLYNRWYINAIFYKIFVNAPVRFAQWTLDNVEDRGFSKINVGGVAGAIDLSEAGNWLDRVVDAIAGGFASIGQWFSRGARRMQTGIVEQYALIFTIGLLIMLFLFLVALGVRLP